MVVSSPGRDSHDSRSSGLAEATEKRWVESHFSNCFRCMHLVPTSHN